MVNNNIEVDEKVKCIEQKLVKEDIWDSVIRIGGLRRIS